MRIWGAAAGRTALIWLGLMGVPALAVGAGVAGPAMGDGARSAQVPGDGAAGDSGGRARGFWQRAHPLVVQRGVLTIDGLTVRTGLSLHVADLRYLYVYVPGAGTAIIAEQPFGGAEQQKDAFHGRSLTVMAGESRVQLTAANRMRGTRAAYVRFEAGAGSGVRVPQIGFGGAALVPAVWSSDQPQGRATRHRTKLRRARAPRTGRLCRPSPKGRETCATVREVVWEH